LRAHVLQHVPFEGLGSIGRWLQTRGAEITVSRLFEDAALPDTTDFELIVALGGPMSVNQEARFPWLRPEKEFLARAVDGGRPVLGICLGAQLIASALGSRVFPASHPEIGWFTVSRCESEGSVFPFPASTPAFHWHGETFDLPGRAVHLARSEACEQQAFQVGDRVIGLQFHLETTPESAAGLISHCRDELRPGPHVQDEAVLRSIGSEPYERINGLMVDVLEYLTREEE